MRRQRVGIHAARPSLPWGDLGWRGSIWVDAFWATYATPDQMSVVADSLTALIEQPYEHRGQHWYWLQPGFERLGDVYDVT